MTTFFRNGFVKRVLAPVVVFGALSWAYFQQEYPTCTFRYKLTAEIMTPAGLKSGSSVIEVNYRRGGDWGGGPHGERWATGEAVYVDLGHGKNLFVLLSNRESGRNDLVGDTSRSYDHAKGALDAFALPIKVFGLTWKFGQEKRLCKELNVASTNTKREVPFDNLPTLVTFADVFDPKSVRVVQPERFETDFGVGYKFLRARIEPTTHVPTESIEGILHWLPQQEQHWLEMGGIGGGPLIDDLWYDSFLVPVNWKKK